MLSKFSDLRSEARKLYKFQVFQQWREAMTSYIVYYFTFCGGLPKSSDDMSFYIIKLYYDSR